ncbi:MAG: hypothetical protein QOC66_3843 [Pseudonocardiales bacterium]|nr:hypothetical protein [Pseudonocardiales bacterium]
MAPGARPASSGAGRHGGVLGQRAVFFAVPLTAAFFAAGVVVFLATLATLATLAAGAFLAGPVVVAAALGLAVFLAGAALVSLAAPETNDLSVAPALNAGTEVFLSLMASRSRGCGRCVLPARASRRCRSR